jgi:hypothetical protein
VKQFLPQLFACLATKELLNRSSRGIEEVLRDNPNWLRDVGLGYTPDHNTLHRAAAFLLRKRNGYMRRWQVETVNSMVKRNLGSALAGRCAWSRKRDMQRKELVHNVTIL